MASTLPSNTFNLSLTIPANRELKITLPPDTPLGPMDITVIMTPQTDTPIATLGDLAQSAFFGLWQDRDDIEDNSAFAQALREGAWERSA